MANAGAIHLYVKRLAPNDTPKNQIYLAGDFSAFNIIPNLGLKIEKKIFKAAIDFAWLGEDGRLLQAPGAQIILYPQYPEVRLSGFLRGCPRAPSELMSCREPGRLLFLGVRPDGKVIAYAVHGSTATAKEFESKSGLPQIGVFYELGLADVPADARSELLQALKRIHQKGWIHSKRLAADGTLLDCNAPHCGGMTLEAELGIKPNGRSDPDYLGWEIKSHRVSRWDKLSVGVLTLITPEPDNGFYRTSGKEAFLRRFGYADKSGRDDRLNFGGRHKFCKQQPLTKLTLVLDGYDASRNIITDPHGGISLVTETGEPAATWTFTGIIEHWRRKHAKAAYVPVMKAQTANRYMYGPRVRLGVGTDPLKFLAAVAAGRVFYDPGIKIENASTKPRIKPRSQFRIRSAELGCLYDLFEDVTLL